MFGAFGMFGMIGDQVFIDWESFGEDLIGLIVLSDTEFRSPTFLARQAILVDLAFLAKLAIFRKSLFKF